MSEVRKDLNVKYAIKYSLPAHHGDVRSVATRRPENYLVTGSRDSLVKLWTPNPNGGYDQGCVYTGVTKYVSSLCLLPASAEYPCGLILAGSNDCAIYGFAIDVCQEPVMKLLAHSNNVCSLSSGPFGTFVSGSWDKTARVWSGQQCHLVLSGHQEAVWAAVFLPEPNLVLTASADQTIRLWRSGKCEKVYEGHTDCVRGLAVLRGDHFLSCSNDCTVRLWSIAGDLLATYESHTAYIYGITLLRSGADFATCGEDSKVKIWRDGNCVQTLYFSGKTLWTITYTSDGYLAVGCSDGTLYILGEVPIDEDVPEEVFETEQLHAMMEDSEDIDSVLNKEGEYDGETRFVFEQENNCMVIYAWDAASNHWRKKDFVEEGVIGNISKLHQANEEGKKSLYFDIDVEGVMYQVVYKMGEDPYNFATKFVTDNNLSVIHVPQIAQFITANTNTKGDGPWNEYDSLRNEKFITYPVVNAEGLTAKLTEFNMAVKKENQLSEEKLEHLLVLVTLPEKTSIQNMGALDTALTWEDEFLFPVLDLLRVAVRGVGMHNKISVPTFINHLLRKLNQTNVWMNCNLIIKIFCNLFGFSEGKETLLKFHERIISSVGEILQKEDTRTEKAGSALFLNYSILASEFGMKINVKLYCENIVDFIAKISDFEAIYRVLVSIANMIECESNALKTFEDPKFVAALLKLQTMKIPKTEEILQLIFLRIENFDGYSDDEKPSTSSA